MVEATVIRKVTHVNALTKNMEKHRNCATSKSACADDGLDVMGSFTLLAAIKGSRV